MPDTVSLGFAIDACVNDSTVIVFMIGKKIHEVVKFKEKCRELHREAELLSRLLNKHRSAIESFSTIDDFDQCLKDIEKFVNKSTENSIFGTAIEVVIKHEYPAILKRVARLKDMFLLESVVQIVHSGTENAKQPDVVRVVKSVDELKAELRRANDEVEAKKHSLPRSIPPGDFDPFIRGLQVTFDEDSRQIGRAVLDGEKVVCREIEALRTSLSTVQLYQRLQTGASVQRYYGICSEGDRLYAILEDLDGCLTIGNVCRQDNPQLSLLQRAHLALDLAKTVNWYHQGNMILMAMSDENIKLTETKSGSYRCVLAGTEKCRSIYEKTLFGEYDVRYEAPEYRSGDREEHTTYTDIWALSTAIWQIMTNKYPWSVDHPIPKNSAEENTILGSLKLGQLPGNPDLDTIPTVVGYLIRQSWDSNVLLRPTALQIATTLQDIIAGLETNLPAIDSLLGSDSSGAVDMNSNIGHILRKSLQMVVNRRPLKHTIEKLSDDEFEILISDDSSWTPLKFFVIGAVIYWQITDVDPRKLIKSYPTYLPSASRRAERAYAALQYLESAASSSYLEAFYEMYHAHGAIAQEMRDRVPSKKLSSN